MVPESPGEGRVERGSRTLIDWHRHIGGACASRVFPPPITVFLGQFGQKSAPNALELFSELW